MAGQEAARSSAIFTADLIDSHNQMDQELRSELGANGKAALTVRLFGGQSPAFLPFPPYPFSSHTQSQTRTIELFDRYNNHHIKPLHINTSLYL